MAAPDIDSYLADLAADQRAALEALRRQIHAVEPDAEEAISYGMPAFKVRGRTVAGFAAYRDHLSYLPHSGSVLGTLADDVAGYPVTKGSLHFTPERPLPDALVAKLVAARKDELGMG